MAQAKRGDSVQIHYTGKLEDGTVFDTSRNRQALRFTIGNGQVIQGFEEAVEGMNVGESKTVTIPVEKAYGARKDDLIVTLKREQIPGVEPKVGQRLEITQADDKIILVTVTAVSKASVTVDANHPLSGKPLTFELELVGIG